MPFAPATPWVLGTGSSDRFHRDKPLDDTLIRADRVLGPRQVTDVYLLALAVQRSGRPVTLDGRIPIETVPGARREHLLAL